MAAESDLYDALSSNTNISDLVSSRIYSDIRDQQTEIPAIYFEKTGVEFFNTVSSNMPVATKTSFAVTCFESTREKAETLTDHIITALSGNDFMIIDDQSNYEEESETYSTTIQTNYLEVN
jgi:hypothetical protein